MKTTRTIVHSDGHTDVETYMKDADGVWIWAVTQCNGGDMARTLNGNLTGKAARGTDEIMVDEPSTLTAEDRARIKDDVSVGYHKYQAHLWAKEVQPVDVDKFLLAMDFIKLQEKPADPLARARAIALPNGQLRSYATYKNIGKAQPLSAEAVDGEQLGMDDHWYHDNPNY